MISVIIPTYNNLELCKAAVSSVLSQTGACYELIVVDDSTDNAIEEYINGLSGIRYYHNRPSLGAIDNWNHGLSLCSSDKILLMHHDESFASSDYLKRLDKLLDQYDVVIPDKKVMIGGVEKRERFPKWVKRFVLAHESCLFALNVIGPCACFAFRRELMLPFDNRLHWQVDVDWYYRILSASSRRKHLESTEIISTHGHEGQITSSINIKEVNKADTKLLRAKYHNPLVNLTLSIYEIIIGLK